jgi:hypothetical protein
MKIHWIWNICWMLLLLTSCTDRTVTIEPQKPEIGFTPLGVPLRVSINSAGEINVSFTGVVQTPIGDFDFDMGELSIQEVKERFPETQMLIVRVDDQIHCYQLEEGKEFAVTIESNEELYKKVRFEKTVHGDIVLEIESVANSRNTSEPFFMYRLVTEIDLHGKTMWELDVMRNEIYARYGRQFNRQDLQNYFDRQPWYTPKYLPSEFDSSMLTPVQCQNAVFIRKYQGDNDVITC